MLRCIDQEKRFTEREKMKNTEINETLRGLSVNLAHFAKRSLGLSRQAFRSRYNYTPVSPENLKELVQALDKHIYGLMLYRDLLLEQGYADAIDRAKRAGKTISKEGQA